MTPGWLISILVVAGVLAVWVHLVRAFMRLREARPELLRAATADGWSLAVWHRPAARRRFATPVVLCHGFGNNAAFFDFQRPWSLAAFLSDAGFACYSVELRGAGASEPPDEGPWDATVDDHVRHDAPAVVDLVCRHAGARSVLWVGHSLGGLVGLASAGTTLAGRVAALCTIGSPVFFGLFKRADLLIRVAELLSPAGRFPMHWFAEFGAPLAGHVDVELAHASANLRNIAPRAQRLLLANAFAPMWRGVLGQLLDWVEHDAFRSRDGQVDYRAAAAALELPVLVVGGSRDHLANEQVQRRYFELLRTRDKELALFGKAHGHAEEYGHGDLVIGKACEHEVYPVLLRWLAARAQRVEAGGEAPA